MISDAKTVPAATSLVPTLGLLRAYLTLLKPKITVLLTVCGTFAALLAAADGEVHLPLHRLLLFALLGFMAAGGAATLNHLFDRDIDIHMSRTRNRPLPSGKISPASAGAFAALLFLVSLPAAWFLLGAAVAILMAVGAAIYSGLYTLLLKRRTAQNIVIGGLAGSCGAVAGWAVVDPGLSLGALLFATLVFLWTPAHFWGLAIARDADYRAVGVPMLPQVRGVPHTARAIVFYAVATLVVSLLLLPTTSLGPLYGLLALSLGAYNLYLCLDFMRDPTAAGGMKVFKFSGAYLALLVIAMGLDLLNLGVPW